MGVSRELQRVIDAAELVHQLAEAYENGAIALDRSTLFGGSGAERGTGLSAQPSGPVMVSGVTSSTDLPLSGEGFGHNNQAGDEKHRDDAYPDKEQFVAEHYFLKSVKLARGTRQNGLLSQEPANVERETVCCFVAAGAILLQRFHGNPVEVPTNGPNQSGGLGFTMFGHSR